MNTDRLTLKAVLQKWKTKRACLSEFVRMICTVYLNYSDCVHCMLEDRQHLMYNLHLVDCVDSVAL